MCLRRPPRLFSFFLFVLCFDCIRADWVQCFCLFYVCLCACFVSQADKEVELEKEIARGNQQDRKMLIEESFLHANSHKPVNSLSRCWVHPQTSYKVSAERVNYIPVLNKVLARAREDGMVACACICSVYVFASASRGSGRLPSSFFVRCAAFCIRASWGGGVRW